MAWDKDKPAGNQKIKLSDEEIRENWDCLEDAMGRDHVFPGTKGSTAGYHDLITLDEQGAHPASPSAGYAYLYGYAKAPYLKNSDGDVLGLGFESGTKVYFYQNVAPTGWTIVAVTDRVLAVKGGSGDYNVDGGNTAGSWDIDSLTVDGHALILGEIPVHDHNVRYGQKSVEGPGDITIEEVRDYGAAGDGTFDTQERGSGNTHDHDLTSDGSWRPDAAVGIIASKD